MREYQFWENKTASWRFVLADMKVIELCRMILRKRIERQKAVFRNTEAPSKLWILCCVCCCGNTGQRLFCVIQWYCINIPEYVHTIAAQAIMLLFNWKLIKYINKTWEAQFVLFPAAVIKAIYLNFRLLYSDLCVFASYCQHTKIYGRGARHFWHVPSGM